MSEGKFPLNIEHEALSQENFLNGIRLAFKDAEVLWLPLAEKQMFQGMATLSGEVTHDREFTKIIDENEYLVLIGLRTKYDGSDVCKIEIIADGVRVSPFIIDTHVTHVVFTNPIIWRPEKSFSLTLEGQGRLGFVCIGATIYKGRGYGVLAFTHSSNEEGSVTQNVPVVNLNPRVESMIDSLGSNPNE